jgi:hypothetical protein
MRKVFVLCLLFALAGLICGCGGVATTSSEDTTTTSGVTISGTVTASPSDLAQLGASTLSIQSASANENYLLSKGFTQASIRAMGLVPMAVSGTTISIGTLNADGSVTTVATAEVGSDGSYSVEVSDFDTSKTYAGVVVKTSGQKTLEMKTIFSAASGGSISGANAAISPQTTLVAQMIIEKVVKVLESANVDPEIIANVKEAIVAAVDALVSSGAITLTAVRDATASENQSMLNAIDKASGDSTIANKLESVKGALGLAKATDLATARGAIKELFKAMTGDPKGIPDEIVAAFAQSFLEGVTKTTTQITEATNGALHDPSTMQAVQGSFTASQVATEIQHMLQGTYSSSSVAQQSAPPAGVRVVIEACFPKATWASKTITTSTAFSVPQIILLIHVGEQLAYESNLIFNAPKAAYAMGLMAGIEDKPTIMHADMRIISFEDWENAEPGQQATAVRALASFVEVGNVVNPTPTETQGYTCYLTYPTASGTKTVQYGSQDFTPAPGEMGPPPGWKMFEINPWGTGDGSPGTKITDFAAGTATITAKDGSGTVVDTKQIALVDIDLTTALPDLLIPKQAWIGDANMSKFPKNSQPTFSWQVGSLPSIPEGYRLGYVIEIVKGQIQVTGDHANFQANWGDPSSRIFASWDQHNFPNAKANETVNWTVPSELTEDMICDFGIGIVAIEKSTNMPIAEGPRRGGLFMVGDPSIPEAVQDQFQYQEPANIGSETLTLEGKVHENILNDGRFSEGTLKVGLFKDSYDPDTGFAIAAVSGVTPVTLSEVSGQTYKTFTLQFSGSVFGTTYGMYQLLLFNDLNGNGELDDDECREYCIKNIDHRQDGTWAQWPEGGDMLVNSQTNFNFLYWGDSF